MKLVFGSVLLCFFCGVTFGSNLKSKIKQALVGSEEITVDWSQWDQSNYSYHETPAVANVQKKDSRSPASQAFEESDLTEDMKWFRASIIGGKGSRKGKDYDLPGVKSGNELNALLVEAAKSENYNSYDDNLKYFLTPLLVSIPLRGIVWRVRPIFEKSGMGNIATHGQAVQMVRNIVGAIKTYFPTNQWRAGIEYFTQPADGLSQFNSIRDLQAFMTNSYIPSLRKAQEQIRALYEKNPNAVYAWDNRIGMSMGAFDDGLNRYVGHGKPEKEITIAALNAYIHDAYFFCAYNQDRLVEYYGAIGEAFGMQSLPFGRGENEDFGITDKERSKIIGRLVKRNWLERLKYQDVATGKMNDIGANYMANAWSARQYYVEFLDKAFQSLQGKDANTSMMLNPVFFQPTSFKSLEPSIKNMKAVVAGRTELRSPVTGEKVEVDLKQFYLNPLDSLFMLTANSWDMAGSPEVSFGQTSYRNYFHGRANGWNNASWGRFIPSAAGKSADYMEQAKRVIHTSRGAGSLFSMVDTFVR